jgi:cytochrome c biogenesis protein CcdA/peroxiredoxin
VFEILIAALAGVLSFLSPCVLPLVPAYISYMSSRVTNTVSAQVEVGGDGAASIAQGGSYRFAMGMHAVAFVLGFTLVFVLFTLATGAVFLILEDILIRLGGVLIVLFGLHFMGVIALVFKWMRSNEAVIANPLFSVAFALAMTSLFLWGFTGTVAVWQPGLNIESGVIVAGSFLSALVWVGLFLGNAFTRPLNFWTKMLNTLDYMFYADTRREMQAEGSNGLAGSFAMGLVFSAGWTPCIGPVLGAAIGLALNDGEIGAAVVRITAFSLGLGIPFIITALAIDSAKGRLRKLNRHINKVKVFTGALLVFIGVMMFTGQLRDLTANLNDTFGELSIRIEECVVGGVRSHIAWGTLGTCLSDEVPFEILKAEHTAETLSAAQIRFYLREYPDLDLTQYLDPDAVAEAQAELEAREAAAQEAANVDVAEPVFSEEAQGTVNALEADAITDVAANAPSVAEVGLGIGDLAPDFQTTTLDGQTVNLSDYRGQVVLLNFWYTTCPPCQVEMPEFQAAYEEFRDQGFVILAVNREEGPGAIAQFADENGLGFPLLLDESGDIQFQYDIRGYPTSFLLDEDGVIVNRNFSILTVTQIEEWITEALS